MPAWTLRVEQWEQLSNAQRRGYLAIVGDLGAEWWGNGRTAFPSFAQADSAFLATRGSLPVPPQMTFE